MSVIMNKIVTYSIPQFLWIWQMWLKLNAILAFKWNYALTLQYDWISLASFTSHTKNSICPDLSPIYSHFHFKLHIKPSSKLFYITIKCFFIRKTQIVSRSWKNSYFSFNSIVLVWFHRLFQFSFIWYLYKCDCVAVD